MSRQVMDIEGLMQQLIGEHRKLLKLVQAHHSAMKTLDLKAMEQAQREQEDLRLRIGGLESRRRALAIGVMRQMKASGEPTVIRLAELFPARRESLLKLRTELREAVEAVMSNTHVAGKVAGSVLGHLNTVVRLLAGAIEQAGVYTKTGLPAAPARLGVMEAVG
jgi:hypothetical protein